MDNWRWAGVPFYIRVGKRLPKGGTEIAIQFKNAPQRPLQQADETARRRTSSSSASSPTKASRCACSARCPAPPLRIEPVKMDFHYGTSFGKASPEAYERLLLDAMSGDATLFARRDEVEGAWSFIDRIEARLAPESDAAAALRISRRFVGPEGSRRPARPRRPHLAATCNAPCPPLSILRQLGEPVADRHRSAAS